VRLIATLREARACTHCAENLPMGANPVFQVATGARILIAGQAPGRRVHESGVAFDDPSGDRLRDWLGIDRATFYNPDQIALLPMGFCYSGTGKSGDLAPRPECAQLWRSRILDHLNNVQVTLVIGQYAQRWHLGATAKSNLTETVRAWREFGAGIFPLLHPSPRNNIWLKKNPWFATELLPDLRRVVAAALSDT
jgi:uracil-DNA glycosylase